MRFRSCVLLTGILAAFACGDDGNSGGADAGADASTIVPIVRGCDQPGGEICNSASEACFEGECAPNACLTESNTCGDEETCGMTCVTVTDACEGVDCAGGTTCYEGSCVAGCFPPSPCLGVTCEDGQYCDGGSCFDLNPCEGVCPAGEACHVICQPVSPCQDVDCEDNEICVAGECRDNPCYGVDCADGAICVNGECLDTCEGCDCEPYETCVFGRCECIPNCSEKACGDDDGCGGKCRNCPTAGDVCNTGNGVCSCNDSCSGKDCGELNGCGEPCITSGGCRGGTCDGTSNPQAPVCVCEEPSVECEEGGSLANTCCGPGTVCYDRGGNDTDTLTDSCCQPAKLCGPGPANQDCCTGSEQCIDDACCHSSDIGDDGSCLCGGGQRVINKGNGNPADDFCCRNSGQACEQTQECCPNGFTCFDSNDEGTADDVCCTAASWCEDSQQCCNVAAGEICYNDKDDDPDNDSCCVPDCGGKNCGDSDGCGGLCDVETCQPGQSCFVQDVDNVYCKDNSCNPQCNPCSEICIAGSCSPKCSDGETLDPITCQCEGGGIVQ
ncbi:MAG: hypothetical protein KJO07_20265 [Deltaproteobacteria bacterium]|nr:hypothetical protein [Deltaproteobacteria bacterium]